MVKKAKRPAPVEPLRQGEGEGPATVQPLSQGVNTALTGYFNDGRKRIDIVLVFKDDGSNVIKEIRVNFLMNIIQFGLEAEVELGKMDEHRDLIFVKLHAPDAIIEECGLYFNEKSFFKDSHLEFINPIVNYFGVANERELIKIVRNQYPGPDNYSTLERSNIVYKTLLQIPFGKYSNHFGLNKLIDNNIIQDAFALHDGPYFIVSEQSKVHMNARQVLNVTWLGLVNVWKTQPLHMIHEYFGKRISYYFAFYEYFNFMLIIPWMFGVYTTSLMLKAENYKKYTRYSMEEIRQKNWLSNFIHPECRNITLCPMVNEYAYEEELLLLARIDKESTMHFGQFMAIWGIFFLMPWRYIERYLDWIWEETKKYKNQLVRPEYEEHEIKIEKEKTAKSKKTKNPGSRLKMFIYLLTAACLGLWALVMFRFSIVIWYYPRYRRLKDALTHVKQFYIYKYYENIYIAVGAGIYTIIICIIKMVFTALAQKVTRYENNRTFLIHERSIALKLYTFSYIGTFMILITLSYLGGLHIHLYKSKKGLEVDPSTFGLFGFWRMNNGLGSTFDNISITLGVITILEHVIFRMIGFLRKNKTDDPVIFKSRGPCWEREYQLKPITELFFHKRYNAIAMQFALLTCFSMMFPVASLILFIINIWDLRHTARQLLLEYRRPLLINTSGPGFWKYLILITALYAPMSNTAIVVFQSFTFANRHFTMVDNHPIVDTYGCNSKQMEYLRLAENDYSLMVKLISKVYQFKFRGVTTESCTTIGYLNEAYREMHLEMAVRFILMTTILGIIIFLCLFYLLPRTSNSLEDAIKNERRIKYKYQTRRDFLKESL